MICLFCKKEMVKNPATLVDGCSECKIKYSIFSDYYYGYIDKNGLQTLLEAKNIYTVVIHTKLNSLQIMDHGTGSIIKFTVKNFTLESANNLIKKVFKMKAYL